MPEQSANILAEPICEAITVVVSTRVGGDPGRVVRRRLAAALRVTLGRPVTGWHVRRVRMTATSIGRQGRPVDRQGRTIGHSC